MFALDRDLLVFEPGLFRDVSWLGFKRIATIGALVGTTVTINTGSFVTKEIAPGHVLIFDGVPLEVVSVESATQATVSVLRSDLGSSAVPWFDASNRGVAVYDFGAQRAMVHRQILTMLGFDPDAEGFSDAVVTNPGALVRLEALGTLHLIYASAAAPGRGSAGFDQRAQMYKERFGAERERVVAAIDLDGDGIAETTRRPNAFVLVRG
jgi:hypothetical protein